MESVSIFSRIVEALKRMGTSADTAGTTTLFALLKKLDAKPNAVITVPSDTIQQSFDTEYQKTFGDFNNDANRRFLVAKFTPKFTGDVKLKVDIKHTNILGYAYGIAAVGSSFRPSTSPSIYATGLSYLTPIGTLLSSSITSGSGGVTNVINNGTVNLAGTYATYEVILQVAEAVPLFVFFSIGMGSQTGPSDYIYMKNVRLCYDLI